MFCTLNASRVKGTRTLRILQKDFLAAIWAEYGRRQSCKKALFQSGPSVKLESHVQYTLIRQIKILIGR